MIKRLIAKISSLSATRQFFLARTFYDWGTFVFDTFYMAFVFKESSDVRQVVYNIMVTLLTVFAGYIFGYWVMNKLGVEKNLRLSFVLYILTGLLGIYLVHIGAVSFLLISCVRGIAEGVFWASINLIELSGLPSTSRSKFYSVSHGVNEIFYIIAPITLGVMLAEAGSLLPSFIIFSGVCLLAALIPFNFPDTKKSSFSLTNIGKILQKKNIVSYSAIKMTLAVSWMLNWLIYSILPFVILGSELNMGIYLTVSSIVGILISFVTSKFTVKHKKNLGNPLLVLSTINELVFAFNFTPVFLYINSVGLTLTESVLAPLEEDLSVRMTSHIDPNFDLPAELNLYQEFIYTMARMVLGFIILWVISSGLSVFALLKLLIVVSAGVKIITYIFSIKFIKLG